jgi:glycosyltransferase involved in cell wall biosynthesis
MSPPLVSILIPAFNAAPWIAHTLESALAQTWPRKEIVVIDDGSTDDTAQVVRRYVSRQVQLVQQPRLGPSAAQNEALRHAQGEFIQRLDADDLLGPDKIARQIARLAGATDCIAAGEWARFHVQAREAAFGVPRVAADLDPVEWLIRECAGGAPMLQPGLWLAPRGLVDAAGPWDDRLTLNNDFEYFVRVLLTSREVRFCEGARLYYRSGNPASLASVRSRRAWQSQLLSIALGIAALDARSSDPRVAAAGADLYQQLAFDAYLEEADVAREAETRAAARGGSSLRIGGGILLRTLDRTFGWKRAKRIKMLAYRYGYDVVARAKTHGVARARARTAA